MDEEQQTIGDQARAYEPPVKTKNIADLDRVSTALKLEDDSFTFTDKKDGTEKTVNQKVIVVGDLKYRVPLSVLGDLKVILSDNPELQFFKVKKTGEGKEDTRYTVIPLSK